MSDTSNDQAGGASPSGPGTQGADNARAYVPPQTLKAKAQPSDDGETAKVRIKDGIDPRKVETVTKGTLPVNQPIPGEVLAHAAAIGSPGGPATPFESAAPHAPPPRVMDNALPFQPAPVAPAMASAPPAHVAPPMHVPSAPPAHQNPVPSPHGTNGVAAGAGFTPKHPPLQLGGPGTLTPMSAPAAQPAHAAQPHAAQPHAAQPHAAQPHAAQPHAAQPHAVPHAAEHHPPAQVTPSAPAVVAPAVVPTAAESTAPIAVPAFTSAPADAAPAPITPPGGVPAASAVVEPAAEEAAPTSTPPEDEKASVDDEHPLAATNSPWTSAEKVDAEDLPSADFLPSAQASAAPAATSVQPTEAPSSGGSRTLMTVGLAVAALALIGAVVYFTIIDRKPAAPDDPAKVDVGSEQRDYDMNEDGGPAPKASEVPAATPVPAPPKPPPVIVPRTPPKPLQPSPPRKKPEDIYDGL